MNKSLHFITQKINAIQIGLIRYHGKKQSISLHVMVKSQEDNTLICAVTSNDKPDLKKLANKRVNLIQKSENDYLYISGRVLLKDATNGRILFIHILKACWFVRKAKGTLSWLQEKHVYDTMPINELGLAS